MQCQERGLSGLGRWQTVPTKIRGCRMWCLIRVCTVCLKYRKLKIKWNNLKSLLRTYFSAYTQRQSTHQCSQGFDWFWVYSPVNTIKVMTDWLCWGLTTRQHLWVILCHLPEKGRKEIEEIEWMKERTEKKFLEEQEWKWRNRRNKNIPTSTLTCYKDGRPCQIVSQYQLDAPVT